MNPDSSAAERSFPTNTINRLRFTLAYDNAIERLAGFLDDAYLDPGNPRADVRVMGRLAEALGLIDEEASLTQDAEDFVLDLKRREALALAWLSDPVFVSRCEASDLSSALGRIVAQVQQPLTARLQFKHRWRLERTRCAWRWSEEAFNAITPSQEEITLDKIMCSFREAPPALSLNLTDLRDLTRELYLKHSAREELSLRLGLHHRTILHYINTARWLGLVEVTSDQLSEQGREFARLDELGQATLVLHSLRAKPITNALGSLDREPKERREELMLSALRELYGAAPVDSLLYVGRSFKRFLATLSSEVREEETVALTQTADSNVPPKGEDGEAAALPPKAPAQGLREDHPVLQKIDPDKVDGLGATTLTRLGVETFYDLLSLDEHTMLNTPGVGRGKVAILRDLTTHAKALVGEDERYAQDEVARSPLDEEISARDVEGIGAATLSELGVKVWRDLLEVDTATLLEVPGVSLIKARVIIELIARARKLASAEDDDIPPTLTQRIEAQGIDPQRLAHQVLVRLSNRSSNAIESAQLTLAEVAARVESHDLKSLAGVGGKSGDELREHILTLAERGYTYYLFGEEGPPKDTPDAVERILASLKPLDRMLLRRRYRDNATLEMLAQDIDQTRERVRQRIKKVLTDAAPIYGEVFHKLLADLINEVDANQGVLNTARALELSPGDEEPWEILFALDLLGRDASVLDEHLFCTLNTDERNELANALTQTLRQVPHRRLTASIARAAIARKHSIDLDDAAVGVLLDRVLGYARVDGAHWQNIGITEGALYATAMAPYEDALTLEEIAAAYQRHNGDPAPPDARHVYNHINRTDAIYRMEEGLYIHADHLPMPAAELADVISQLVEMVRTRGEVVDVSELRAELLRDGLIDPAVTTALLHNALSRREDVKIFKGSTTEVAPAGSGLERTTLTERIEEILEELNEVSTPAALQPMLSARGYDTSEASINQSLVKSASIYYLGEGRYIHRAAIGLSDEFLAPLIDAAVVNLEAEGPIGAGKLLDKLAEYPASHFLKVRANGADIFWGVLNTSPSVTASQSGHLITHATRSSDPLEEALRAFASGGGEFAPKDARAHIEGNLGAKECTNALAVRLKQGVDEGWLRNDEKGIYVAIQEDGGDRWG